MLINSALRFVAILGALAPLSLAQSTWYVDPVATGPGSGSLADPYASLQFALLQPSTSSGDTIQVMTGTLFENVVHPAGLVSITIEAFPGAQVVFDGMNSGACYRQVNNNIDRVTFRGALTFTNGSGAPSSQGIAGGALRFSRADLIMDGAGQQILVTGNSAEVGGGIYVSNGDLTMTGVVLQQNTASDQGGPGLPRGGALHLRTNAGNHSLTAEDCLLQGNSAVVGGALFAENVSLSVSSSQILDNDALFDAFSPPGEGLGGGLALVACDMTMNLESRVADNRARLGGGFHMLDSTLELVSGSTIQNNSATSQNSLGGEGGGVYAAGQSSISGGGRISGNDSTLTGGGVFGGELFGLEIFVNVSQSGGGVYGASLIEDCEIRGNRAEVIGSIIATGGGVFGGQLKNCVVLDNIAEGPGGGVRGSTLVDCSVIGNRAVRFNATSDPALGGGLMECTATGCIIEDNHAQQGGGAATSDLINCEVRGNRASDTGQPPSNLDPAGGGLVGGSATGCIISGNTVLSSTEFRSPLGGGAAFATITGGEVSGNSMENNSFFGSVVPRGAGLFACDSSYCRITGNGSISPTSFGGGVYGGTHEYALITNNIAEDGAGVHSTTLINCTVAGNPDKFGASDITAVNTIFFLQEQMTSSTLSYCRTDNGFAGVGNIASDPEFVDFVSFGLMASSPCIDAGDPTTFDPDGTRADMGAIPFDSFGADIGMTVCYSNPNSTGGDALLTILGSPVITDNSFALRVVDLPMNQAGYFLMSESQVFIPLFSGSQGNLCVGSPQIRFNQFIQNSRSAGSVLFVPNLFALPQGTVLAPGEVWYFQYWSRDLNPTQVSNTSSAVSVQFQ